jgi:hypothetical protein
MTPSAAGSRRTFWWVLALFATPLALSFALYYGSGWRPAGRTNHGELITPPRPLPSVTLPRIDKAGTGVLSDKWSLVYVGGGSCDDDCRRTLYFTQQTQLSLGQLMPRIQRIFLVTHDCCASTPVPPAEAGTGEQTDLLMLDATGAAAAPLRASLPMGDAPTTVYIVDPRGNLMMRYDSRAEPKGLREDLKKLLDLSHIG